MERIFDFLLQAFKEISDSAKLGLLIFLVLGLMALAIWKFTGWRRFRDLRKKLRRKDDELRQIREDRNQLQARLDSLDKVDEHVWTRPDGTRANHFVSAAGRQTRFVALCNLKGGVGKTTLTVNLGAGLAQRGKRVLLVDFDFQATLSNFLLANDALQSHRSKEWTVEHLIKKDNQRLTDIIFPVQGVPNCWGLIAREQLEILEYAQQARFFVNQENEVRFLTQALLHTDEVFQAYDYVLFDCPPRMTTACINALTCADYVLIPTTLSQFDIEAVPRTLKWLKDLHQIVRAEFLGAIVTRCKMRTGQLVSFDRGQLKYLERTISQHKPGSSFVFQAMILDDAELHRATADRRPLVLDQPAKFAALLDEFEQRVRQ